MEGEIDFEKQIGQLVEDHPSIPGIEEHRDRSIHVEITTVFLRRMDNHVQIKARYSI